MSLNKDLWTYLARHGKFLDKIVFPSQSVIDI